MHVDFQETKFSLMIIKHPYTDSGFVSIILLEQIRIIDKSRLIEYIGKLTQDKISKINTAIAISLNFI